MPLEIFRQIFRQLPASAMLSIKLASSPLSRMTLNEQGQNLVDIQATFLNETCEAHKRQGHSCSNYTSYLMYPLVIALEAALPDGVPLELTCSDCREKHGLATMPMSHRHEELVGFTDDHFKKRRLARKCFQCLHSDWKQYKISLHGQEFVRCGRCGCFEPSEQLATVQDVRDLSAKTFQHFVPLPRAAWPWMVLRLQIYARRGQQLCGTCFEIHEKLQTDHPNTPACDCGAEEDFVTQEALQKLSADMFIALTPFIRKYWPSKVNDCLWHVQSLASAGGIVCKDCYEKLLLLIGQTRDNKAGTPADLEARKRNPPEETYAKPSPTKKVKRAPVEHTEEVEEQDIKEEED